MEGRRKDERWIVEWVEVGWMDRSKEDGEHGGMNGYVMDEWMDKEDRWMGGWMDDG